MIREYLETSVKSWAVMGHPAIMERFVLRHGKLFDMGPRVGAKRQPNQCFFNATRFVLDTPSERYEYVEGFVLRPKLPIALQHGWVRTVHNDSRMIGFDPTLDVEDSEYMGVVFDTPTLIEQLRRNKVYGVLDHGHGINTDLIFKLDPELKPIVEEVIANRKVLTL